MVFVGESHLLTAMIIAAKADPEQARELGDLLGGYPERSGFSTQPDGELLTTAQAAGILGVHQKTVERWCREGVAEGAVKIGRTWRLPREALASLQRPAGRTRQRAPLRERRARRTASTANGRAAAAILGKQER